MQKVTVIKAKDVPIRSLTEAERELKYRRFAEKCTVDDYHFDNFLQMDIEANSEDRNPSSVLSILLKQCLRIADPIIGNINGGKAKSKTKSASSPDDTTGDTPKFNITVQLDHWITAYSANGKHKQQFAANTALGVCGISIGSKYQTNGKRYDHRLSSYTIDELNSEQFIRSGLWNIMGKSNTYTLEELFSVQNINEVVIFKNEKHAREELLRIFHKIQWVLENYKSSVHFAYFIAKQQTWSVLPPVDPLKKYHWVDPVMDKLDTIIDGSIVRSSRSAAINSMQSHDILHLYYSLITLGASNEYVKAEINKIIALNGMNARIKVENIKHLSEVLRLRKIQLYSQIKYSKEFHELNKTERDTIKSIYERKEKLLHADIAYPLDVVYQLWDIDQSVRLNAFKLLLANDKLNGKISIQDVICPHLYSSLIAQTSKVNDKKINRQLIQEYSTEVPMRGYYYCKLCGEEIAEVEEELVFDRAQSASNEGLTPTEQLIWGQTVHIVNSYVNFKYAADMRIIKLIATTINTYIDEIDGKLNKLRTLTHEQAKDHLNIYISIYIYAVLIQLINNARNEISFKAKLKKTDISKSNTKSSAVELFQIALNLIDKSHNMDMNRISMDMASVKKHIVVAYNRINTVTLSDDSAANGLHLYIASDPVYLLIGRMQGVRDKRVADLTSIKNILHTDAKSVTADNLYNNVMPLAESNFTNEFHPFAKLQSKTFNTTVEYFRSQWDDIAFPTGERLLAYYAELTECQDLEKPIIELMRLKRGIITNHIHMNKGRKFQPQPVDISLIYGPDGKKINWDIYIVTLNGKRKELTIEEINDLIGTPAYDGMKIVDYKSSTTLVVKSKTNLRNVITKLHQLAILDSFYNFYQFKCPVRGLHDFKEQKSCAKCKITYDNIEKHSIDYFQRWKAVYDKEQGNAKMSRQLEDTQGTYIINKNGFKLNTTSIGKISKLLKIEYNQLLNLGLTEGITYSHLISKEINPSEKNDKNNNDRILRLLDYYYLLIRWSNLMNNKAKVRVLPFELIKLVELHPGDWNIPLNRWKYNEYKIPVLDFIYQILQKIFDQLVLISDTPTVKDKAAVKEFIAIVVNKMLSYDLLFSNYSVQKLRENVDHIDYTLDTNPINSYDDSDDEFDEFNHDEFSTEGMDFEDGWESNIEGDQGF